MNCPYDALLGVSPKEDCKAIFLKIYLGFEKALCAVYNAIAILEN